MPSGIAFINRSQPKEKVEKIRSAMEKKQAVWVGRMDEQGGAAIRVGKHDEEPRRSWKRHLTRIPLRPGGSLLLSCRALSSPTTSRLIPGLSEHPLTRPRGAGLLLPSLIVHAHHEEP
jgi:hypothetical protein